MTSNGDLPEEETPWAQRTLFFRRSIIRDVVCPILGLVIAGYQVYIQSGLIPAYVLSIGLIGLPGVERIAALLGVDKS